MQTKTLNKKILAWVNITKWLNKAKDDQSKLREEIIEHFFPDPKEGTNKVEYNGFVFIYSHKIERKIDEAALPAVLKKLPKGTEDRCVKYKPSLIKKGYDLLPEHLQPKFDEALIIKVGSLNLKLEPVEK